MAKRLSPRDVLTARAAAYKTQGEAAVALGISQPYLNDLLAGRRNFSRRILEKLGLETVVVKKGAAA